VQRSGAVDREYTGCLQRHLPSALRLACLTRYAYAGVAARRCRVGGGQAARAVAGGVACGRQLRRLLRGNAACQCASPRALLQGAAQANGGSGGVLTGRACYAACLRANGVAAAEEEEELPMRTKQTWRVWRRRQRRNAPALASGMCWLCTFRAMAVFFHSGRRAGLRRNRA